MDSITTYPFMRHGCQRHGCRNYLHTDVKEVSIMGISIQSRNDYSYLFNSMNTNSGNSLSSMNWLSDYNSIKSGSYGKLMKAYYSSAAEESSSSSKSASKTDSTSILSKLTDHKVPATTASDEAKAFNKAATSADALQSSIKDLSSLKDDADDDKIYDSLSKYVKNYNSVLDTAAATTDKAITNRLTSIKSATASNEKALNGLGISIGSDGKLSINKDTFNAADKSGVKDLFAERRSYASNVSVSAAMIQSTANYDSARESTYTATGVYSAVTGSLWDSTT